MENKQSLANRAIQAWKTTEEERKETQINQTAKFVEEAKKRFEWVFRDEKITSTKAIDPSNAEVVCEDVTFIAQKREGGIVFLVEVKCQRCGKLFLPEYANNVNDLVAIGSRLNTPQKCGECLKETTGLEHYPSSTEEVVLEKVREIYNLIKEE